jgi:signal transduction histidine kinase
MKDRYKTKEQLIQDLTQLRKELSRIRISKRKLKTNQRKFQKQLIEYEKLSALGRLTANVAHEIRNPITVIGGFSNKIKESVSFGTNERELIEIISLEAKRLEDILREVLIFSNKPFFRKEKCDINKIIFESLKFYKDLFEKVSITVKVELSDVAIIYIDKRQVKEGIDNLISNSIDAMPEGGTLTIATQEKVLRGKSYVTVKITDTGVGISEENMLMIFEPFFTTKLTKKETGLGLSITKKIVEGHGGFMKVESKTEKGSTFTLYFPYRAQ